MNDFVYHIPTKIYFGKNQLGNLGKELRQFGDRVLLTYGGGSIKKTGLYEKIVNEIKNEGLTVFELSGIEPNPRVAFVNEGAKICKEEKIDVILAVGGGSVIDCSKFIGAATFYDGDAWDIMVGKTQIANALPLVTVLTLAATGSEMDASGVISNPNTNDKLGQYFEGLRPKVSFLDPTNTYTVDKYQTACGAADIMSHIIEIYFNMNKDLYMLDNMMEGLMKTVIKYAPIALKNGNDYEARANLMWASSWAINGFINGGKAQAWTCHPIEHELSAFYDITHGLGLAIVIPRWMKYTLNEQTVDKYHQFALNVFGVDSKLSKMEAAKKGIDMLSEFFFDTLGLKSSLSEIGIDDKHFDIMSQKAASIGGTEYGFVPLKANDIKEIYKMSL